MRELEPDTLARITSTPSMQNFFPTWAGQMVIVKGKNPMVAYGYRVRRLHDGAGEWFYRDQLELPEEQNDA